jgi:LCP family protein required for cell wall assembly
VVSQQEDMSGEKAAQPGKSVESDKPDFMVWPPIPDLPRDPKLPGLHRARRRSLLVKLLTASLVMGVLLVGSGIGAFFLYQHSLDDNIGRIGNPFASLPEKSRPRPAPNGAMNILLLGSENRISSAPGDWAHGAESTDAIMVAHIPANRSKVTVASIPRDSLVSIPGHGKNKLSESFRFGGPSLLVQTVENLTSVRIDHVVILDFAGFKNITDELGGVSVDVPKTAGAGAATGPQQMDGATALNYVRQRQNLPGGDLDRVRRQQNWIRAVTLKTLDKGTLTSPRKLTQVLSSLTNSIAADDDFTIGRMRSLAISLRDVRGSNLTFLTAPVVVSQTQAVPTKSAKTAKSAAKPVKQPVVHLDLAANRALWAAVANDTVTGWLNANPGAALGQSVH